MLEDLGKLKKMGFTFILKLMGNADPLVKVGGGYMTLDTFLRQVLEKISKQESPRQGGVKNYDPGLVSRLNTYLRNVNTDGFKGRFMTSPLGSPRGNFVTAVVQKEEQIKRSSLSPRNAQSRKSVQLTPGFSLNIGESGANYLGDH